MCNYWVKLKHKLFHVNAVYTSDMHNTAKSKYKIHHTMMRGHNIKAHQHMKKIKLHQNQI